MGGVMVDIMKKSLKIRLLLIFFIVIVFALAYLVSDTVNGSSYKVILNDLDPLKEVFNFIRNDYIDKEVDPTRLVQGAIKGMLQELNDPYSRYLNPITFQREQENILMGHFGGLGIHVTMVEEQLTVISPIEDTPAYQAGIKANDKIMAIDGESTKGISLDEAVNLMRGEEGTAVTLTIKRENIEDNFEVVIIRATISVEAVKEKLLEDNQIGYIRISTFNANTGPELKRVLNDFSKIPLEGIIIDLRNNPGGLLESAIDVASQFIKVGDIVRIKGRSSFTKAYYSYGNTYPDWPLVVLVNKGSASASEIVAGAIQDNSEGVVLGETSFGKGLVQQIYPLSDNSAVTISTSEYYTPKGRVINNIGIEPDISVTEEVDSEEDVQLEAALNFLLKEKVIISSRDTG